jgi:tetratricopeptide (TPR) repeat protein
MSTQDFRETTFLGHAHELTLETEVPQVLQNYIRLTAHGALDQASAAELSNALVTALIAVSTNPSSIHAWAGLGAVQRALGERNSDVTQLRAAAASYLEAARAGVKNGRIMYTYQLSQILPQIADKNLLSDVFDELVAADGPAREHYSALVAYGAALAALGDQRAAGVFEAAIQANPDNNIEALNRYAAYLLTAGRAADAKNLLETQLTRERRVQLVVPSELRLQAAVTMNEDSTDATQEVADSHKAAGGTMMGVVRRTSPAAAATLLPRFSHTNDSDDCRGSTSGVPWCDQYGNCFYDQVVNLAEILYNEAHSEQWGSIGTVGWTARDRVLNSPGCDTYPGGKNGALTSNCRAALACAQPGFCPYDVYYCCVEHGGTTTTGTSQTQFNDSHVDFLTLWYSDLLWEAVYIENGYVPELSPLYVWGGAAYTFYMTGCDTSCGVDLCTGGGDITHHPGGGPFEFRNYQYTAGNPSCKEVAGFVCGNGGTDNYFWAKYAPR